MIDDLEIALRKSKLAMGVALAGAMVLTGGCTSIQSDLPLGQLAYAAVPDTEPALRPYAISPGDILTVSVHREPELSVAERPVDPGGHLNLPLIGSVLAAGATPESLAGEIEAKLRRYVVNPRVSVGLNSVSQTVAVEGSVNQPGVYAIPGRSSLLEAMALAQSPTNIAALDQVIVFREVDGQRAGARFDLRRIRAGLDPDPVILPGDRVVVGFSNVKEAWLEYLAVPVFNIFRLF